MDRRDFLKISTLAAVAAGVPAIAREGGRRSGAAMVEKNADGISILGYGCMRWPVTKGDDGKNHVNQEAVNELVEEAMRHGVTYFDTAPVYMKGESEHTTSVALNRYPRSEWILATKLSNFRDWSYEASVKMYRNSLEQFNTDYIDYYLLHSIRDIAGFNKRFGDTGIMEFLMKEREAGHIRNLGFSFHGTPEVLREMMALDERYHWDFVQIEMNYLEWTKGGRAKELYEILEERGIPIMVMEPLRGGALATIPEHLAVSLKEREPDRSIASWAFRFVGSFPAVTTVLSGMTYMDHLKDNLETFGDFKPLEESDFALLEEIAEDITEYPLVNCTSCQYCMPCPYGIDIPGVFGFYNRNVNAGTYVKSSEQKGYSRLRRRYISGYDRAVEKSGQADHCIMCGKCMKACPQKIKIPAELRRIDEYVENLKRGEL